MQVFLAPNDELYVGYFNIWSGLWFIEDLNNGGLIPYDPVLIQDEGWECLGGL